MERADEKNVCRVTPVNRLHTHSISFSPSFGFVENLCDLADIRLSLFGGRLKLTEHYLLVRCRSEKVFRSGETVLGGAIFTKSNKVYLCCLQNAHDETQCAAFLKLAGCLLKPKLCYWTYTCIQFSIGWYRLPGYNNPINISKFQNILVRWATICQQCFEFPMPDYMFVTYTTIC